MIQNRPLLAEHEPKALFLALDTQAGDRLIQLAAHRTAGQGD